MSIVLERNPDTLIFNRRVLRNIKDLPQDMMEALVDKVEITGNIVKLRELTKYLGLLCHIILFALAAATVFAYFFSFETSSNSSSRISQALRIHRKEMAISWNIDTFIEGNHEWLEEYFHNMDLKRNELLTTELKEKYKQDIMAILDKMEIPEDVSQEREQFLENKTAALIADTLNKLKKDGLVQFFVIMFVVLLFTKSYVGNLFYRNQELNVFKNVNSMLTIENETYFCRRGYVWTIDDKMMVLKISKINIRVGKKRQSYKESLPKVKLPPQRPSSSPSSPQEITPTQPLQNTPPPMQPQPFPYPPGMIPMGVQQHATPQAHASGQPYYPMVYLPPNPMFPYPYFPPGQQQPQLAAAQFPGYPYGVPAQPPLHHQAPYEQMGREEEADCTEAFSESAEEGSGEESPHRPGASKHRSQGKPSLPLLPLYKSKNKSKA